MYGSTAIGPDQVLSVIGQGVPNTRMDGWSRVLDPPEIKAVAAYVYFLAKLPVPDEIRRPEHESRRSSSTDSTTEFSESPGSAEIPS